MPKRALMLIMALAVLLTFGFPALATRDKGNSTQEVTTPHYGVAVAYKARHLASARASYHSGLKAWHYWHRKLRSYQQATWYRERLMRVPRTRNSRRLASAGLSSLIPYAKHWGQVNRRVLYKFRRPPPSLSDWMCIHHYEGSWQDPNSPYWGGLQMDLGFQSTYGGWLLKHKGTADHWTPMEQIWVAVRAYKSRGFSPWPNTAHACGLY